MLPKAKLQNMVIYIIHFKVQKNKIGIVLGLLSIDLVQKEGVIAIIAVGKSIVEQ